ncbi:SusC/RagA family TonB-linked outer membrane protein [Filimonas effusa]|uniref:SusC/RagA family TonB-linked outer membrane protein n=1 Tax=Filimonas effusa TaxID=2508721 RepID=A0A4Q1D980_9BACT|nr:SusC/RagA family TonB-linked outer membrane protein [Filimonas effusa]RXK85922.1 SusC/RagA family TonB-linked outer membrane protein [Filimonas effusa]
MPGKTLHRLVASFALLLFAMFTHAQDASKTINARLLGLDGSPQRDYTLQSKMLGSSATTSEDGKFSLKVNVEDSILILFQGTQLGAVKVPAFTNFQVQFAENNKFNIKEISAEAAKDTTKPVTPAHDSVAAPVPADTVAAPVKDSAPTTTPGKPDSAATAAARPDTATTAPPVDSSAVRDTVFLTGKVIDMSGKPVSFATIAFASGATYNGGEDGSFRIPFKTGATVKFSAVGYSDKDVVLVSATKPLDVQLSAKSGRQLQEVKVTALGVSKKGRAVGYAIQEVKGEAVQVAKEQNFVNALQGKLAGVQINGNSGSMGGSSKVVIRGAKSITGNNNALFVVDGIFMGNNNPSASYNQQIGGGGYDYGSPIQDINPDDIEQISVLKGAAATALYGSRGSNGVVLVTTKKGTVSGKLGITYSINAQTDKVYVLPKYQNRYGAGGANTTDPNFVGSGFDTLWYNKNPEQFLSEGAATYSDPVLGRYDLMPQFAVDESWGPALNGQIVRPYYSFDRNKNNPFFGQTTTWSPQPDNLKDFYRTGLTLTNSISISGGSDKGTFRLSYSNLSQRFMVPEAKLQRNNIGFNGTYKVTDEITAVASANYSYQDARGRPGTGFSGTNFTQYFTMYGQRQLELDKLRFYQFADGSQVSWNRKSFADPTPTSATSPYWAVNKNYQTDNRDRLFGLAGFEVKATDWLNFSAKVFMDQFSTTMEERLPKDYQTGGYNRTDRTFRELNYLVMANAKKDLSRKISLNASAGANLMQQRDEINTGSFTGLIVRDVYNYRNALGRVTYTPFLYKKEIQSVFGDAVFGYDNTVFLEITGRNDWSSTLGPGNNSYFYPSASLSAVFSDWLKWKWLSFGKARASVAQIGSDTDPYRIYPAFNVPGMFGSDPTIGKDAALANPGLKPERSTETEAGLELKFLNNRIGLDITVYNRITNDLIVPLQVSQTSGYSSYFANIGKSRTRGLELEFSATPLELKNGFTWNIGANFAMNRSRLLELNFPNNPGVDRYVVGTERRRNSVSAVAIVGQPLFMLTGTDYIYDNYGNKVVDETGHYLASDATKVLGTTQPDFVGGISNSFSFKGISLSALLDFQKGGSFFSYTNMYGKASGILYETAADNIRETGVIAPGVTEGGATNTVRISAADHFKNNFGLKANAADVYDAGFLYLREVRLGYELPEKWANVIKARNARLTFYGRNLWLIHSNAPNVDPSNIINSDSNIQGLEGGALPSVRSFGLNLTVGF